MASIFIMMIIVKITFSLFDTLLEVIYILFYPVIYLLLNYKNYLPAISCEGEDTKGGILFHAASMGEVNAIRPLVLEHLNRHPQVHLCITTSSVTGLRLAKGISPKVTAYLSVLDVPHLRNRQLKQINPSVICIVETEIWLNMLFYASRNKIPVLFLNARMSARSVPSYNIIRKMINYAGQSIKEIHAQSETDAERFRKVFNKPVYNSGNLKYSLRLCDYDASQVRKEWGYSDSDFIVCWGSSRPGEEELLLSILPGLQNSIAQLKIIIAVRHQDRIEEVKKMLSKYSYRLWSSLPVSTNESILVIDTVGVLDKAYAVCNLAIVGGSFYDFGGHNPLEPAYYAKAVIIGNFHCSCKDSVKKLLLGEGIIVSDNTKLAGDIIQLASDPALMDNLGKNANKVLQDNSHALDIQLKAIENIS